MPSSSTYSAAYKAENKPNRGDWADFKRCGRPLPTCAVQAIFQLRTQGLSAVDIAKELKIHHKTVSRYLKHGRKAYGAPQPPIDAQVAEVHQAVQNVTGAFIARSFAKGLRNLDKMQDHMGTLIEQGKLPDQATPLALKQIAEATRMIVTLPQDMNRDRQSLYEQLGTRDLGLAEECDEVDELAGSGQMALAAGANDSDKTGETSK